jgi:hypothetical protein
VSTSERDELIRMLAQIDQQLADMESSLLKPLTEHDSHDALDKIVVLHESRWILEEQLRDDSHGTT